MVRAILVAAMSFPATFICGGCSSAQRQPAFSTSTPDAVPSNDAKPCKVLEHVAARASEPTLTNDEEPAETIESIPGIASVRRLGDASVELALSKADVAKGWELHVDHNRSGPRVRAMPIEYVSRHNWEYLGMGWHAFQYVGDRGNYLVFREKYWFYDIIPETSQLIQVLPYEEASTGDEPTEKPPR